MEKKKRLFFPFCPSSQFNPWLFCFWQNTRKKKRKKSTLFDVGEENKQTCSWLLPLFLYMTISGRLKESGSGSLISPFSPPFASFRAHFPPRPVVPTHSEFSRRFHRDPPNPPPIPPTQPPHPPLPPPPPHSGCCLVP